MTADPWMGRARGLRCKVNGSRRNEDLKVQFTAAIWGLVWAQYSAGEQPQLSAFGTGRATILWPTWVETGR